MKSYLLLPFPGKKGEAPKVFGSSKAIKAFLSANEATGDWSSWTAQEREWLLGNQPSNEKVGLNLHSYPISSETR
jgi:hypothetical protein